MVSDQTGARDLMTMLLLLMVILAGLLGLAGKTAICGLLVLRRGLSLLEKPSAQAVLLSLLGWPTG